MENADPRQRLLELAGGQGVSLSELSRLIGKNPSYLQQFVRKGSPRKLDETHRAKLARFFGVGESELGAPKDISSGKSINSWVDIPRLPLGVSAGPGSVAENEQAVGALRFSDRWLREQGLSRANLSAVSVIGDSMEPTLRDGDEILVDRTPAPMRNGIHVVRLDDTLYVKRLDTGRPGRLAVISDNPAYPALDLPREDVAVIGRVVWKGGRL